ncbi:MAG: hypothetical protein V4649_13350 [Bacteroidota bacterium]
MKGILIAAASAILSTTAYAQSFKIATGEPLHSTQQEMAVKGRQGLMIKQKLTFGDYRTAMVKRSAIRKWTGVTGFPGSIWTEHMEGKQSIHFRLANTTGGDTSDVMTVTNVMTNDLLLGTPAGHTRLQGSIVPLFQQTDISKNNYSVSIVTRPGDEPWEMFLDNTEAQVRRKHPAGYVARGDVYYTIEPVWQVEKKNGELANMPFGSPGFEIKNSNGDALAAVSLIDNGKVYLGPGTAEEKALFANVCTALLLQSVIN